MTSAVSPQTDSSQFLLKHGMLKQRKQILMMKSLWKFIIFTPFFFSFSLRVFSELKVKNKHPHSLFTQ